MPSYHLGAFSGTTTLCSPDDQGNYCKMSRFMAEFGWILTILIFIVFLLDFLGIVDIVTIKNFFHKRFA
jgi:hypothetical protein